jgi:hypothetical protein
VHANGRLALLENFKNYLIESKATRKIAAYEKRYRIDDTSAKRHPPVVMEATFDAFVDNFGGEKISKLMASQAQMPLNADYFFREYNVIAELKTLEGVYSGPEAVRSLSQAFIDSGCQRSDLLGLMFQGQEMPKQARDLVGRRIRRSFEQRIKKARKQLRQSKITFGDGNTRTLILFAMDQQPLFGHKVMLSYLAKVMDDNYSDQDTDGVVYLNPNTPSKFKSDGMDYSGWYPFYRDEGNKDGLADFVNLLGNRWLTYYGQQIGETNPILEFKSAVEALTVLRGPYEF